MAHESQLTLSLSNEILNGRKVRFLGHEFLPEEKMCRIFWIFSTDGKVKCLGGMCIPQ